MNTPASTNDLKNKITISFARGEYCVAHLAYLLHLDHSLFFFQLLLENVERDEIERANSSRLER